MNAIQDFSVEIDDLPLKLQLEDGTELTGLSVGDDIAIEAPTDFDVETMGDMDGLMDFDVEIDMDAIFSNLTTLGLTGELFTGLLKLTGGVSSDFFDGFGFNLFSNQKNGSTTNDSFLLSDTFDIFDAELPPIFEESFDLGGFNTVSSDADTFYFDIA